MAKINRTCLALAHRLIADGQIDLSANWLFAPADHQALLGQNQDMAAFSGVHLGITPQDGAPDQLSYPIIKRRRGKMVLYRSAILAARAAARRNRDASILSVTNRLLELLDQKQEERFVIRHRPVGAPLSAGRPTLKGSEMGAAKTKGFETTNLAADSGIKFVSGKLKDEDSTVIQTVIFDKAQWDQAKAKTWLKDHDLASGKVDETKDSLRFRQRDPDEFDPDSMRTITAGKKGSRKNDQDNDRDEEESTPEQEAAAMGLELVPLDDALYALLARAEIDEVSVDGTPLKEVVDPENILPGQYCLSEVEGQTHITFGEPPEGEIMVSGRLIGSFEDGMPRSKIAKNAMAGIKARIGKIIRRWDGSLEQGGRMGIQALLFDTEEYSLSEMMDWLRKNNFWSDGFTEENGTWLVEVKPKDQFDSDSLRDVDYSDGSARIHYSETVEHAQAILRYSENESFASFADKDSGHVLKGVEIFKTGTWKGDKYETADLDAMIDAFDKVGYRPPVKLGHSDKVGEPAYGWVERIYRKGQTLLADIADVPKKVYEALKKRHFDTVSSEIYWDLERNGKKFSRALKAVALLGAEIPAVSGLAPLRTVVASLPTSAASRSLSYTINLEHKESDDMSKDEKQNKDDGKTGDPAITKTVDHSDDLTKLRADLSAAQATLKAYQDAGVTPDVVKAQAEQIARLSAANDAAAEKERQATIKLLSQDCKLPAIRPHIEGLAEVITKPDAKTYSTKIDGKDIKDPLDVLRGMIASMNKVTARLLSETAPASSDGGATGVDYSDKQSVAEAVHQLTAQHMAKHNIKNYGEALKAVLAADADLKAAYGRR